MNHKPYSSLPSVHSNSGKYRLLLVLIIVIAATKAQDSTSSEYQNSITSLFQSQIRPSPQYTTFNGISNDEVVSYIEFNGNMSVNLDISGVIEGGSYNQSLNYTLMFWMKMTEPVGSNTNLMQIFKFNQSLGCYIALS